MSDIKGYELRGVAESLGRQFVDDYISDMELLAAMRKLKSVYILLNRPVQKKAIPELGNQQAKK